MSDDLEPLVGQWYRHLDKGQTFQVVSVDTDTGLVETQMFDGDLEELELAEWAGLDLEPIDEPEDITGPLDDVEPDDLGFSETDMGDSDWGESLQSVHPHESGMDEFEEDTDAEFRRGRPIEAPRGDDDLVESEWGEAARSPEDLAGDGEDEV
ncbi:MAG: hypothetical protein KDK91_26780 [Gammaproteobacteria bacterium]|nr:hypothetical protein [Gammaproteobacteria bacterium]